MHAQKTALFLTFVEDRLHKILRSTPLGLDLIAAKLDETAKTEAALILLAMNAAHALARWLLRFFQEWPFWRILWLPGGSILFFQ